jgi:hypothetical protein
MRITDRPLVGLRGFDQFGDRPDGELTESLRSRHGDRYGRRAGSLRGRPVDEAIRWEGTKMAPRTWLTVASTLCGFVLVGGVTTAATAATAVLVDEQFTGSTTASPNWVLPTSSAAATNGACLTGSSNSGLSPVPGCASPGAAHGLQLTTNGTYTEGGIAYRSSVPSSLGLDVRFNSYQYSGTGADGIAFFLAASDPTNAAASPITLGPAGGYLSYAPNRNGGIDGLTHGYLGIGLDVYGNYTSDAQSGDSCTDSQPQTPESVTVRGPGDLTAGYCLLGTTKLSAGALDSGTPTAVPVEVAINPTNGDLETASKFAVPANHYVVVATPIGGTTVVVAAGKLPSAADFVPAGWVDNNGVPLQLTFGWSGSTGASTDFHTISDAQVKTLNGTPPALSVTLADDSGGTAHPGQTVNYTATTTVSSANETRPITMTDTFPDELTPQLAGLGGTTWDCHVSGQTVTCTHPPVAQGSLDAVHMPVVVATAATDLDDTVTVGSPDATQGSATETQTYLAAPTATVLTFTSQPVNSQVNATMTNADATTTHVRVAAKVTADGAVDRTFQGTVTLAFPAGTPGNPQFIVAGSPTPTLSATAIDGVADFNPIAVNTIGFGYKLQATADGLSAATSSPFDVSAAATACPSGQTCTETASSPDAGVSALVQALPGAGDAIISASYGGSVAPIHPCKGTSQSILTFSGNRQKLITLTLQTKRPVFIFCYGQPTPFIDITLHKTKYFSAANQDYEGILPPCLPSLVGPCVKSLNWRRSVETVVIATNAADPHIMQ